MQMSESINEISSALSAAQKDLPNAVCDTRAHGYKYAKLVQYINLAKDILPMHGLAVSQFVESSDSGKIRITTMLCHSSGQWFKAVAVAPEAVLMGGAGKNPVQVAGSQITYMRRYQYAAILGMTDNAEDNDAQGLVSPPNNKEIHKPKPTSPRPTTNDTPKPIPVTYEPIDKAKFDHHKLQWAKQAMGFGKCGLDRLHDGLKKKGVAFSEGQIEDLENIIIDEAKKAKTKSDDTPEITIGDDMAVQGYSNYSEGCHEV